MKKKILLTGVVGLLLLSGCSKGYKEGVYTGTAIDNYGGQENTATAIVTIDSNGKITDVNLDTTYTKDGVETTKKALGDDYGMYNHPYGSTVGEWYQQVEALEEYVVDNQGIDNLNLNDGYTDAVSSCTIKIDALYEALDSALKLAKK
ncbi:MAG: FMN-binding protein [Bacilli bacterium]|nr:FMN-binding protein [Bacilli bacterium]